jgi:hypothetical protein
MTSEPRISGMRAALRGHLRRLGSLRPRMLILFTHGICVDCIRSLYPEHADRLVEKMGNPGTEPHAGTGSTGEDERSG